tara:strand:- start:235702 stop:236190 length:489 start_codon:yes stop_codon:yes gene_type:complete
MKTWNSEEHALRTNITQALDNGTFDIATEIVGDLETLFSDAAISRKLYKSKKGSTKMGKFKVTELQKKKFDQIRERYFLIKQHLDNVFDLSQAEKLVIDYLNHWSVRLEVKKIQGEAKQGNKSSVRRFKDERKDKRAMQQIHVNEEVYSETDEEELFSEFQD